MRRTSQGLWLAPRRSREIFAATVAVCLLCLVPVFAVQNPPLHDYPFHIARMHILTHWHESPLLQSYYTISSFMLPNVAMDIMVQWLSGLMPVESAGRVFIGLTLVLQITGCMVLHRAIYGRYSVWPLVSVLYVFNWIFIFGFLNYLFGVGVLLWSLAIWMAIEGSSAVTRLAIGTVLTVFLFFCHIIAVGLFAVIIAGYELQRAIDFTDNRRLALKNLFIGASIFVAPAVLFLFSHTATIEGETSHSLINLLRTPAIFVRILLAADWPLDVVLLASTVALLAILLLRGSVIMARAMRLPILLLVLTFLFIPHQLSGDWAADSRIPIVIVFVLIASTRPVLDVFWSKAAVYLVFGAIVVRSFLLIHDWTGYDRIYAEYRRAFAQVPPGAVLITASEEPVPSLQDINLRLWHPPLLHVACLAALDRDVFVPQIWAKLGQQPIVVVQRYRSLYMHMAEGPPQFVTTTAALDSEIHEAQELAGSLPVYVLLLYPSRYHLTLPQQAQVIASGTNFLLLATGV